MKLSKMPHLALIFAALTACGPDPKQFESLKTPHLTNQVATLMLVAELHGDPNTEMKDVSALFKTWYSLPMKDKRMVAPRARWPKPFNTPRGEWVGIWAMPVPRSISNLPAGTPAFISLQEWTWGATAEILHVGPYSTELPTVEKLHAFISNSGYEIAGDHEEEYIVGPGMFGPGDTNKYLTIIRYPVKPAAGKR